jgi:hypothetical protein
MQRLHGRPVYRRRILVDEGRLQTELVQIRWDGLGCTEHKVYFTMYVVNTSLRHCKAFQGFGNCRVIVRAGFIQDGENIHDHTNISITFQCSTQGGTIDFHSSGHIQTFTCRR